MKIHEAPLARTATITIKSDSERCDLETKTVKPFHDMLLLEVVKKGKKIVSFKTLRKDLRAEITVTIDGCPMVWRNVLIDKITIEGKPYYVVRCKNDSEINERRRGERVPTLDEGFVQLEGSRATPEVVIKNISRSGLALIINSQAGVKRGSNIKVTFYDEQRMGSSKIIKSVKYEFHCKVERIEEPINDRMVVGVSIPRREQYLSGNLARLKMA